MGFLLGFTTFGGLVTFSTTESLVSLYKNSLESDLEAPTISW
jgi:hypothetical protein